MEVTTYLLSFVASTDTNGFELFVFLERTLPGFGASRYMKTLYDVAMTSALTRLSMLCCFNERPSASEIDLHLQHGEGFLVLVTYPDSIYICEKKKNFFLVPATDIRDSSPKDYY